MNTRINKSFEVAACRRFGMIIVDASPDSLNADLHPIPAVHLDDIAGAEVKAYVSSADQPTARSSPGSTPMRRRRS